MTPENGGGSHPPLQESEDAQDGNDAPRSRRGPSPPPAEHHADKGAATRKVPFAASHFTALGLCDTRST